jgi:hypothetical protein
MPALRCGPGQACPGVLVAVNAQMAAAAGRDHVVGVLTGGRAGTKVGNLQVYFSFCPECFLVVALLALAAAVSSTLAGALAAHGGANVADPGGEGFPLGAIQSDVAWHGVEVLVCTQVFEGCGEQLAAGR